MTIYDHTWPYMTIHDHTWLYLTIYDHTYSYLTIHDHTWPYMTTHDHTWPHMTIHDHTWPYMTINDHTRPYRMIQDDTGPHISTESHKELIVSPFLWEIHTYWAAYAAKKEDNLKIGNDLKNEDESKNVNVCGGGGLTMGLETTQLDHWFCCQVHMPLLRKSQRWCFFDREQLMMTTLLLMTISLVLLVLMITVMITYLANCSPVCYLLMLFSNRIIN